jgi:hypothetical protein
MTDDAAASNLRGDRPKRSASEDLLGFGPLATQCAKALSNDSLREGMVVGIEGAWGSGKSTLLNLIIEKLDDELVAYPPIHVAFSPWLISEREGLLRELFSTLQRAVLRWQAKGGSKSAKAKLVSQNLLTELGKYSDALGFAGGAVERAGKVGLPLAKEAGGFLKWCEKQLKGGQQKALTEIKASLEKALRDFNRRIIVSIDDLDRLDPREIAEVFRLVKSVADLPQVVYLMCYDRRIVGQAIQSANSISNGEEYLEKIVQISLSVPQPEPFVLRGILRQEIEQMIRPRMLVHEATRRLSDVVNGGVGARVRTLRDIARIMDRIRFGWPAIRENVDAADYVWLEIIRATSPGVYDWIQRYLPEMAMLAVNAQIIGDTKKSAMHAELEILIEAEANQGFNIRQELENKILGISFRRFPNDEDTLPIFQTDRLNLTELQSDKRLSSPDHYRFYFALTQPYGAPTPDEFEQLKNALDAPGQSLEQLLVTWVTQHVPGGSKLAQMLDRLSSSASGTLTATQSVALFRALANVKPSALLDGLGAPSHWSSGADFTRSLRGVMAEALEQIVLDSFSQGADLDWLVEILRRETFSHGIYGNQQQAESDRIFNSALFAQIQEVMLARFRATPMQDLLAVMRPLSLLYGWLQILPETDNGEVGLAVTAHVNASDENMLSFFECLSQEPGRDDTGLVLPRPADIERFVDLEALRVRLTALSSRQDELSGRARVILNALTQAAGWR